MQVLPMNMTTRSPFVTRVEKVTNDRLPGNSLFRYQVCEKRSGRVVFEGVAADVTEAVDSMNAWMDYTAKAA